MQVEKKKYDDCLPRASKSGNIRNLQYILSKIQVDPAAKNNQAIRWACENGHVKVVRLLLCDPRVDPSANNNESIIAASLHGHVEVVKLLLLDARVDPGACNNKAFEMACCAGQVRVVQALMSDPRVNTSANDNFALQMACCAGHPKVVSLLLTDPHISNGPLRSSVLLALINGRDHIHSMLMSMLREKMVIGAISADSDLDSHLDVKKIQPIPADPCRITRASELEEKHKTPNTKIRVGMPVSTLHSTTQVNDRHTNPYKMRGTSETNDYCNSLLVAIYLGKIKSVKQLLAINLELHYLELRLALNLASWYGQVEIVQCLLQNARMNSAANFSDEALKLASRKGHLWVVSLLLADAGINGYHESICAASKNGHLAVVKLLLLDGRANPAIDENLAIRTASARGDIQMVRLLLSDSRVNPSDCNNSAIRCAARYGYVEVIQCLLEDRRLQPVSAILYQLLLLACKYGHLNVVKFLLLDRRLNVKRKKFQYSILNYAYCKSHQKILQFLLSDARIYSNCSIDFLHYIHKSVSPFLLLKWIACRSDFSYKDYPILYQSKFCVHLPDALTTCVLQYAFE